MPLRCRCCHRRLLLTLFGLLTLAVLALALHQYVPANRTRGMTAEAVVRAAGLVILEAKAYRFSVALIGEAVDPVFPIAKMGGVYQREPLVLHLSGTATSGETELELEYYLAGEDLYVRNPRTFTWMLFREADLDELHSFQPANLAAPLLDGLLQATVVGHEQLNGGDAIRLSLDLDPGMMQQRLGGGPTEQIDYTLWVYTRSLKPARFEIAYRAVPEGDMPKQVKGFTYGVDWEFGRFPPLAVPEWIKKAAAEMPLE